MKLDEALRRYRKDRFTDHNVTSCTGLSVRAWRELIKIGAVQTVTDRRGPGRVRLCDATTFKRAAIIAALNKAGFSLAASGRIAYFLPYDFTLYAIWDPCTILLQPLADVDRKTRLPPRVEQPKTDWFDLNSPATADPDNDWLIEIYEARFIGLIYSGHMEPFIFGDLRNDGTSLACWYPFHKGFEIVFGVTDELAKLVLPKKTGDAVAKWGDPNRSSDQLGAGFLDYKFEDHSAQNDQLRIAAKAAADSPIFKTTINITLAIRKALRRYLGIDPTVPGSEIGETL
jgi:hypothetical protein